MKSSFALCLLLLITSFAYGQYEQAPILEKEINYQDWTYKNVRTGEDAHLRSLTKGKKLTMVVYFAPWCGNWRHDAPKLQKLYDKYKDKGLQIIGVGEYDPVASITKNLDSLKITFPVVYESESRADRQKTQHFTYRRSTGDDRGWGSPWYIFLMPSTMEKKGDLVTKKTFIVNGELKDSEGDPFIRKHLGLPAEKPVVDVKTGKVEVCEPDGKTAELKKP